MNPEVKTLKIIKMLERLGSTDTITKQAIRTVRRQIVGLTQQNMTWFPLTRVTSLLNDAENTHDPNEVHRYVTEARKALDGIDARVPLTLSEAIERTRAFVLAIGAEEGGDTPDDVAHAVKAVLEVCQSDTIAQQELPQLRNGLRALGIMRHGPKSQTAFMLVRAFIRYAGEAEP